jgi:Tol biopolymer transport system component
LSAIADTLLSSACGVTVETVELPTPIPATATAVRTPQPSIAEIGTQIAASTIEPPPNSDTIHPELFSRTGVVFVSDRDGDREILVKYPFMFVNDSPPSEMQQLTDNNIDDNYPAWSPDGTQIAWVSDADLWVMNATGTGASQLTDDSADELDPAWSPDGTQIAFASDRNGDFDIWLLDVGTGEASVLIQKNGTSERAPSWSPDGESLVYMSDASGGRELYVFHLSSGSEIRLTDNAVYDGLPDWHGSMIVFATVRSPDSGGEFEIYRADASLGNADQSNAIQVTANQVADDDPAWSPDGQSIVYQTMQDGQWDLWIIDGDGNSRMLIGGPSNETAPDWGFWPSVSISQ